MESTRRSRRHRNPKTQEPPQAEQQQQPFFSKGAIGSAVQTKPESPFFQAKLTVGAPNDAYEREADAVADNVVNQNQKSSNASPNASQAVQKQEISSVQRLATPDEDKMPATNDGRMAEDKKIQEKPIQMKDKKEEEKPVQKADKKEEEKPVQKADKKEEEKPVQKANKKEEEKPVQKADKKEEEKPVQKADKKEEEKPVQKADKKEEEKPVQKADKKEEEKPVQKADKKEEEKPVQKMGGKEEEEPVQTKSNGTSEASAHTSQQLAQQKGKGKPLPRSVRTQMEQGIGADFSQVRVHTDSEAVEMNEDLNAQAFTHGRDVYFNNSKYNPDTTEGKRLLAHELTHVVQQNEAPRIQRQPAPKQAAPQVALRGHTDADYSKNGYSTRKEKAVPSKDCVGCSKKDPCFQITGELVSTFQVSTSVTLPDVDSFSGLTACQKDIVRDAIDTVLKPHELQHVAAFETYNGVIVTPFDWTICKSEYSAKVKELHGTVEAQRRAAAQGASDALDNPPFVFHPNLTC